MKNDSCKPSPDLAKGQLWKVRDAYIQIVERGQRLIHYKILKRQDQPAGLTRMIRGDALQVYLKAQAATLVTGPAGPSLN